MRFIVFAFSVYLCGGALAALSPIEKVQWPAKAGEFLIKLKGLGNTKTQAFYEFGLKEKELVHVSSGVYLVAISAPSKMKSKLGLENEISTLGLNAELIKTLEQLPEIEFVEPNYMYELYDSKISNNLRATKIRTKEEATPVPNDEFFEKLWGMTYIQAPESWKEAGANGARDVVVAIFDTGITIDHPDLAQNVWKGENSEGNEIRGYNAFNINELPIDEHGHGTHVAGTIGAVGNNDTGVAGVSWNVKLLSVKIFGGPDASFVGTSEVIKALDWSTDQKVDLTSHSWGGGAFSKSLYEAIGRANEAGIPLIAASGNGYNNNDETPQYPASYDHENIISVAAIGPDGTKADFSNWGLDSVDIAAPGVDIFSTFIGGDYTEMSGTSMATPHVSGALAYMLSQDYWLQSIDAKDRILETAIANDKLKDLIGNDGGTLNLLTLIRDQKR